MASKAVGKRGLRQGGSHLAFAHYVSQSEGKRLQRDGQPDAAGSLEKTRQSEAAQALLSKGMVGQGVSEVYSKQVIN